ncbi:MAG TPA: oxygenase MpaB family protein [Chloroflexota bacterium]|nr:oxygenase MpaB family protein [Chloroflexota bacterium]
MRRSKVLTDLPALDPVRDCQQILKRMLMFDFPFEMLRAAEFGLFKAYCVPEMSRLLDATRQIYDRPQARYENTMYSILGLMEEGPESDEGRAMVRHMNHLHGHYNIAPKYYRYTLAASVMENIKLIDGYGWRKLTPEEKQALFAFYGQVAKMMNAEYFDTIEELARYYDEFELTEFRFSVEGHYLAVKNINLFVSWYPARLAPLVRRFALTMLGPRVRAACALRTPPAVVQRFILGLMLLRAQVLRYLPAPDEPISEPKKSHLFYRGGFQVGRLREFEKPAPVPDEMLKHPEHGHRAA